MCVNNEYSCGIARHYDDSKEKEMADRITLGITMMFITFGNNDYKPKYHPKDWDSRDFGEYADFLKRDINCLKNLPKKLFGAPTCGNGFVENGEECDCGLPSVCKNLCCTDKCELRSDAKCWSGKCCDLGSCQIAPGEIVENSNFQIFLLY